MAAIADPLQRRMEDIPCGSTIGLTFDYEGRSYQMTIIANWPTRVTVRDYAGKHIEEMNTRKATRTIADVVKVACEKFAIHPINVTVVDIKRDW